MTPEPPVTLTVTMSAEALLQARDEMDAGDSFLLDVHKDSAIGALRSAILTAPLPSPPEPDEGDFAPIDVALAFANLGHGQQLRAMHDSGLFTDDTLHDLGTAVPHLRVRGVTEHVVNAGEAESFIAICEGIVTPPPPSPPVKRGDVVERGPIFESLPSGLDIMRWFLDKWPKEWVGCGGDADYILWHDLDAGSGSHIDLLAHVDHDASWFWLLDVGTYRDHGDPTYDLLFVASDLDGKRICEWRNEPSAKHPWHRDPLVWFADQIESFEGREAW